MKPCRSWLPNWRSRLKKFAMRDSERSNSPSPNRRLAPSRAVRPPCPSEPQGAGRGFVAQRSNSPSPNRRLAPSRSVRPPRPREPQGASRGFVAQRSNSPSPNRRLAPCRSVRPPHPNNYSEFTINYSPLNRQRILHRSPLSTPNATEANEPTAPCRSQVGATNVISRSEIRLSAQLRVCNP